MEIKDKILREDMEEIAQDALLGDALSNSTVFITGATGLLGSQAVWALRYMNRSKGSGIRIVAMARSEDKVRNIFGDLSADPLYGRGGLHHTRCKCDKLEVFCQPSG